MRKQRRAWMAMAMAVAMVTATISSVVPENGITSYSHKKSNVSDYPTNLMIIKDIYNF